MPYADGTFTSFKQQGPTRVSYPLLNYPTKDKTAKRYDITGWVIPSNYTPANALSTFPGDGTLAADNVAYLVEESQPSDGGGYYVVGRAYCNIPNVQTRYGSLLFDRPSLHDVTVSNYYGVSFDDGRTSHVFTARKTVTSLSDPEASFYNPTNAQGPIGHYQVAVEMNSSAQSFYLDDSDATIKNALSTAFIGSTANAANFYISRWKYGIYISWAGITATTKTITVTDFGVVVSSRTVTLGAASTTGPIEFTSAQTVLTSVRTVTSASHGAAAGNRVALYNGNRIVALSTVLTSDTNTYQFRTDDLPGADEVVTHCVFDKDGTRYVNGGVPVSTKITETYYLPGVSPGITTPADITLAKPETDPVSWLGKIAASASYAVVNGAELEVWQGPIYRVVKTEIDVGDALVTVAATG